MNSHFYQQLRLNQGSSSSHLHPENSKESEGYETDDDELELDIASRSEKLRQYEWQLGLKNRQNFANLCNY